MVDLFPEAQQAALGSVLLLASPNMSHQLLLPEFGLTKPTLMLLVVSVTCLVFLIRFSLHHLQANLTPHVGAADFLIWWLRFIVLRCINRCVRIIFGNVHFVAQIDLSELLVIISVRFQIFQKTKPVTTHIAREVSLSVQVVFLLQN